MIEFRGNVSKQCQAYILKKLIKIWVFSGLFTAIIVSILLLLLAFFWNKMAFLFLMVPIAIAVVFCCVPQLVIKNHRAPKIKIENDYFIVESGEDSQIRNIEDLKEIIDMGDWYDIVFYFPNKSPYFVCQKDLIIKGSIEEFEELFANKIIRRNDNL